MFSDEDIYEELEAVTVGVHKFGEGFRFFRRVGRPAPDGMTAHQRAKSIPGRIAEYSRRKKAKIYADPVRHEAYKAWSRERDRKKREANPKPPRVLKPPTSRSAIMKRQYAAIKADPVKLEKRRRVALESYHRRKALKRGAR